MHPYNTRSAARKQALAPYKNVIVSPSATGKGTHIRWIYPSDEEVPNLSHSHSLESEDSFDRPETPDQGEDEGFQRSPTVRSVELADDDRRSSPIIEDFPYSAADQAITERMLAQLQQQKKAAEERMSRMADAAKAQEERNNLQPNSNRPGNSRAEEVLNLQGPKLPVGIVGFGRTGTWVADRIWRPNFVPSTDQLPSIREFGEEKEVQSSLPNNVTQEDLSRNPGFRMLTPLPSFVTGNGAAQMR
ncbi:hypothetical protein BDM02DRAFT_3108829 [Thelephora ganbajun]|uniref:Uncharacterized protein n=1 Tax=Thelephora ganbajun TaxID=370292 RepID=A0ACB6ZTU5_THEGA|nr:hypothetical protein BDM02DRAFT_3108829 [Thelephora ganbajun]